MIVAMRWVRVARLHPDAHEALAIGDNLYVLQTYEDHVWRSVPLLNEYSPPLEN